MVLKIVGTGLGRTGTKSLQSALNMLGCGPCHHMIEVFAHPESTPLWIEAAKGRPDWEAIFAGYHAVVDYPGAQFWRELTAYYPNAKVLHTVRDPDLWFADSPSELERAKALCADCPIRRVCLAEALERAEPWGVWGGEILDRGSVVNRKRPRGRPRKDSIAA